MNVFFCYVCGLFIRVNEKIFFADEHIYQMSNCTIEKQFTKIANFLFFFQIDLVDDIPNKDDEDMDDVTIIETVQIYILLIHLFSFFFEITKNLMKLNFIAHRIHCHQLHKNPVISSMYCRSNQWTQYRLQLFPVAVAPMGILINPNLFQK